jgi:hypothetical protein
MHRAWRPAEVANPFVETPLQSRRALPLLQRGRATHRTLSGGPSSGGGPRRADALVPLPQRELTFWGLTTPVQ